METLASLVTLAYLAAAILFIFGIKGLTHPRTAVRGNRLAALGMLVAIVATVFDQQILTSGNVVAGYAIIIGGFVVGGLIGLALAVKIEMTSMPELVAVFNGFGGIASVLVAGAAFHEASGTTLVTSVGTVTAAVSAAPSLQALVATAVSGIIGTVTFWGSLVAFAKLAGYMPDKLGKFRYQLDFNILLLIIAIVVGIFMVARPEYVWLYWIIVGVCTILGITLVSAIGGADMPVAIALLNSYSGLAASATGFVLSNQALIISGALVGASGLILTSIMTKAMNRSLMHVLVGGLSDAGESGPTADEVYEGKIKATSAEEIAMLLDGIQSFCVVPGYGMAVAQAQHAVRDLCNLLEEKGANCTYAIHPVAGRMPGHMNVLLAEADVPYDKLLTLEEANPTFAQTDVAFVIGANDVVNPDARKSDSPIAGMPILDVDQARTVIVVKRSLSPGYAGIPNPLFAHDNTLMYFSDGKKAVNDLIAAVKDT